MSFFFSFFQAIRAARLSGEPIVVHCSGGGGRAGLGLAVGLIDK
jgi:protein-tyrosine phosphatase